MDHLNPVKEQPPERAVTSELRERIEEDARRYGGTLPREAVIGWEGYLAALIEWDVLSIGEHERLSALLPRIEASPVTHILLGWDEAES